MAHKKKSLLVLSFLLVVLSLVTLIVKNIKVEKEKISNILETVIEIDSEDILDINWVYEGGTLSLSKNDGIWYLESDETFPVNQDTIADLLNDVSNVDVSFIIEEVSDYEQYGLDDPNCIITFHTQEKEYSIAFGDYSSMDEERYINIDDGNVYLLSSDFMEDFDLEVDDLFLYEEVPDMIDVTRITISGENNLEIVYQEENEDTYSNQFHYFLKKGNKMLALGNEEVEDLIDKIRNISFRDYSSYNASSEDISAYGMDNPRISVTITYQEEEEEKEFTIELSSDIIPEDDETMKSYARILDSENVYFIYDSVLSAFLDCSYDTLRSRDVIAIDSELIQKVDIELDEESYEIVSSSKDDAITYTMNEEEIKFSDVLEELDDLSIDSYTEDIPDKSLELKMTIYLDNENYPKLILKFYKYDSGYCLLNFNDEYKALIERSDVVDLIEEINSAVLN